MIEQEDILQRFCNQLSTLSQQTVRLDADLLQSALRHRSDVRGDSYERLEFLGDRVLSLHIAEILFKIYPDSDEGGLAKRHAHLVSGETLSGLSRKLDLDRAVSLVGNSINDAIRADVMEAILGYLYRTEQMEALHGLIDRLWLPLAKSMQQPPTNPRGTLQEWTMQRSLQPPEYAEVERTGTEHAPQFCYAVKVKNLGSAQGWGKSKQAAKTAAAEKLVERLSE